MKIVVWKNHNTNTYFYKIIKGWYSKYEVGDYNQYNHEIVLVIDGIYEIAKKTPIKKRLIRRIIRLLEKL